MPLAPAPAASPKSFDFRGTTAYARDEVHVVETLHEALADVAGAGLKSLLRATVALEPPVVEMARWHDYLRSLGRVTVLGTISLAPLEGHLVVEIDARFALALVERLLGGTGALPPLRRPSQLEAALLTDLFGPVLDGIAASLAPLVEVHPKVEQLTFDPEFLDVAEPSDAVVVLGSVATVTHEHGRATGLVTVCYPLALLAPVLQRHPVMRRPVAPAGPGPLREDLPGLELDVAVELRPTPIPANELTGLRVGDVLRLAHPLDAPVRGVVGDVTVFTGRAGVRDGRRAVELLELTTGGGAATPDLHDEAAPAAKGPS